MQRASSQGARALFLGTIFAARMNTALAERKAETRTPIVLIATSLPVTTDPVTEEDLKEFRERWEEAKASGKELIAFGRDKWGLLDELLAEAERANRLRRELIAARAGGAAAPAAA